MSNKTKILAALNEGVPIAELLKKYAKGSVYKWQKLMVWQQIRAEVDYLMDTGEWDYFTLPRVRRILKSLK